MVVRISSRNVVREKRKTQMHRLCNVNKQIAMNRMIQVIRVSQIVSDIKVTSHDKNIIDVCFNILKIL